MANTKLNPAAPALEGQDRPDHADGIRTLQEYWRSSDLPDVFREADRELLMARLGQDRWQKMKEDLMCGRESSVRPIDYCVDISPEDAAYLGIDPDQFLCEPTFGGITKMLDLRGSAFMWRYALKDVEHALVRFEDRVPFLARICAALKRGMFAEAWASSAAQQGVCVGEMLGCAPGSRKERLAR